MKMSYHQYSRYAPLKPDISLGAMGLSQISMNHAVKEPLLEKYAANGSQESDGPLRANCKVQERRTTW